MTPADTRPLETPSGKSAGDENFPVGSILIAARLRPHVAAFYAFARAADDIADNPDLTPADKIARLDAFDRALSGEGPAGPGTEKAAAVARSAATTGVPVRHARDLLAAFRQDAEKARYASWDELMAYCALSAAPVGRFLLDLHGEDAALYRLADPLCGALQVLNHLQDLRADYDALDRLYLPADWMAADGVREADLGAGAATPALRRTVDRCLDACREMIGAARPLPARLRSRRLAMESAVVVRLADRLAAHLRRADPIAGRVALSKPDFGLAAVGGVAAGLLRRG